MAGELSHCLGYLSVETLFVFFRLLGLLVTGIYSPLLCHPSLQWHDTCSVSAVFHLRYWRRRERLFASLDAEQKGAVLQRERSPCNRLTFERRKREISLTTLLLSRACMAVHEKSGRLITTRVVSSEISGNFPRKISGYFGKFIAIFPKIS